MAGSHFGATLFSTLGQYRRVFPGLFTMFCFALFGPAIITGVRLASDPNVQYFIGGQGSSVIIIPILLIVCHLCHIRLGKPNFFLMMFSTVIPALLIFFVGYSHYVPITGVVDRLRSSDCTTYELKYRIESAYRAARTVYDTCLERIVAETGSTMEAVASGVTLQECQEYGIPAEGADPHAAWRREWVFLQGLETQEECTGWCHEEEPMWLHNTGHMPQDICSNVAATVLAGKVERSSLRMVGNAFMDFFVSVCTLGFIQEVMNHNKMEW